MDLCGLWGSAERSALAGLAASVELYPYSHTGRDSSSVHRATLFCPGRVLLWVYFISWGDVWNIGWGSNVVRGVCWINHVFKWCLKRSLALHSYKPPELTVRNLSKLKNQWFQSCFGDKNIFYSCFNYCITLLSFSLQKCMEHHCGPIKKSRSGPDLWYVLCNSTDWNGSCGTTDSNTACRKISMLGEEISYLMTTPWWQLISQFPPSYMQSRFDKVGQ